MKNKVSIENLDKKTKFAPCLSHVVRDETTGEIKSAQLQSISIVSDEFNIVSVPENFDAEKFKKEWDKLIKGF